MQIVQKKKKKHLYGYAQEMYTCTRRLEKGDTVTFFLLQVFFSSLSEKKRFVSTHVMDRTIKIKERFAIRNHH